jgi:FAD/FMN-containing dehydrogenase
LRDPSADWILGRPLAFVAYAALLVAVIGGAIGLATRGRRPSRVLVPAVVVVVWPLMAVFSSLGFVADGRYSIIAFPFLAVAAGSAVALLPVSARGLTGVAVAAVVVWIAAFVWPHTWRVTDRGSVVDADAATIEVVDFLQAEGIEHIAGDYWRVLPIEYFSDLDITGAVTQPATVIRFPDRQREVQAAPVDSVAFVFQRGATPVGLWLPADRYRIVTVGETDVYLPQAAG